MVCQPFFEKIISKTPRKTIFLEESLFKNEP